MARAPRGAPRRAPRARRARRAPPPRGAAGRPRAGCGRAFGAHGHGIGVGELIERDASFGCSRSSRSPRARRSPARDTGCSRCASPRRSACAGCIIKRRNANAASCSARRRRRAGMTNIVPPVGHRARARRAGAARRRPGTARCPRGSEGTPSTSRSSPRARRGNRCCVDLPRVVVAPRRRLHRPVAVHQRLPELERAHARLAAERRRRRRARRPRRPPARRARPRTTSRSGTRSPSA